MAFPIEVTPVFNVNGPRLNMSIRYDDMIGAGLPNAILAAIATRIAERFVDDHYQEIAALVDQKAIATLTVAEAARHVRDSLENGIASNERMMSEMTRGMNNIARSVR